MSNEVKRPFVAAHGALLNASVQSIWDWQPNLLNLGILLHHFSMSNPIDARFNYAAWSRKLDYASSLTGTGGLNFLCFARAGRRRNQRSPSAC